MPLFIGKACFHGNLPFSGPARCQGRIRIAPRRNPINELDGAHDETVTYAKLRSQGASHRPRSRGLESRNRDLLLSSMASCLESSIGDFLMYCAEIPGRAGRVTLDRLVFRSVGEEERARLTEGRLMSGYVGAGRRTEVWGLEALRRTSLQAFRGLTR